MEKNTIIFILEYYLTLIKRKIIFYFSLLIKLRHLNYYEIIPEHKFL